LNIPGQKRLPPPLKAELIPTYRRPFFPRRHNSEAERTGFRETTHVQGAI